MNSVNEIERSDILQILERRTDHKSTIYASQITPEGWRARLGQGSIADAILDRITNTSYGIYLQGRSLREEYSKLKKDK